MGRLTPQQKLKSFVYLSLSGSTAFAALNIYQSNDKFYKDFIMPVVHLLDPEKAHKLAVFASKYRLIPKSRYKDPELLKTSIFGKSLSNPIGIAAGFDKHADAVIGLHDLGFGFVEVGSVTPQPQLGNDKPRVFRLAEDHAVINRYGFNSVGHQKVFEQLNEMRTAHGSNYTVGVNLGKNKLSSDPIDDYVQGVNIFGPVADYLVINISSPNTPGLRSMQTKVALTELLKAIVNARNNLPEKSKPNLLLKLAPDLSLQEREEIAEVLKRKDCHIDGLIISNTTVQRPESLKNTLNKIEIGGLSGQPLKDMSTQMIADMFRLTDGMTIIGVGGIFTGEDAYEKIKAGAKAVQLYTSLVYEGPPVVSKIKKGLTECLIDGGFQSISEAVGKNAKPV